MNTLRMSLVALAAGAVVLLTPTGLNASGLQKFTPAQIRDLQGDLMLWMPELKPTFVDGYDPIIRMNARGEGGKAPRGVIDGWVWTVVIHRYPKEQRLKAYAEARRLGYTHWAMHVGTEKEGPGYHGIFPISAKDVETQGQTLTTIHDELVAAGLIPFWVGVAPNVPPARGLDRSKCLAAMTDWDNSSEAEGRIKAVTEAFPGCPVWYELPGAHVKPTMNGAPIPDDTGTEWLKRIKAVYPTFVGVLHEVNAWDGDVAWNVAEFVKRHAWWRDVGEWSFETNTYQKFWFGTTPEAARAKDDAVMKAAPWLRGSFSGATPHPPPAGAGFPGRPAYHAAR